MFFSPIWTIFELVRYINKTNVLTKLHDHWAKKKVPRQPGSHETHVLTKFHNDWTKNMTSSVFTCFHYIHIEKTAPPPGGHVFTPTWTIFEFVREFNKTNVLTKFHDDWAKIVTSRVFTSFELDQGIIGTNLLTKKTETPTDSHVFKRTGTTFALNQHIIKTNILTKLHKDWA
ncbi:hypothetical protein DPMN_091481 [Dreissena polymorpha]|uniref:Uncharacterized protein n=1 Tax=Dreissena polymorpha TaxID=45954 RepID=A0A9D4R004_DREPO|nr:hypothetical protein DPMN_091481 [Dreissena polymorpha]